MGVAQHAAVSEFLSRFPDNLRREGTNSFLPRRFTPFVQLFATETYHLEDRKFYEVDPVPDAREHGFIHGRGSTCYVIGGGKSVEFLDFDAMDRALQPEDLVIAINGGSCYFESDIIFYSGAVRLRIRDEDGGGTIQANGGLLHQFCHAHSSRKQLVYLPFHYDVANDSNREIAGRLEAEYGAIVVNVMYSDLWATKKKQPTYDLFEKAVNKRRLYGMGADFGPMAICCALMWGARELRLIGFDGRFMEGCADKGRLSKEDFFETMWAGPQEMYSCEFDESITREQYDFVVVERNRINEALFGYIRRYCQRNGAQLRFLTPSMHAEEAEYLAL